MWIGKNVLAAEFHHCPGPHSQRLSQSDCFEDLLGVWTKNFFCKHQVLKGLTVTYVMQVKKGGSGFSLHYASK